MKIEQTVKEYRLSDYITLSNGDVEEIHIIINVSKKSVSIAPSNYNKEFVFRNLNINADDILRWQTITKLMYAATNTLDSIINEKKEDEPISTEA